jgi:hypothetical protein
MKARGGIIALLLGSAQAISTSIISPRQAEANVKNNIDLLIIFVYYTDIIALIYLSSILWLQLFVRFRVLVLQLCMQLDIHEFTATQQQYRI